MMTNRNVVTILVLLFGMLAAGCAHDSSTNGSTAGGTASQDASAKKQSSSNRAPDVPLNQQGGY
jgi:hypothetical protein